MIKRACLILGLATGLPACVPSQTHSSLDTRGARWITAPDSSPSGTDIHYLDKNNPSAEASPSKKTLSRVSNSLEMDPTASRNVMLISTEPDTATRLLTPEGHTPPQLSTENTWPDLKPPLSPGDRIQVNILNGEEFSGLYEVDLDGTVNLPFLPQIHVAGKDVKWAEKVISGALVNAGFFREALVSVDVAVQQWAPVQVNVSGAVFVPGMVTVNVRPAEEKQFKANQISGDAPTDKFLAAALRSAGGVRPDAAVDRILLIRDGKKYRVDMSGHLSGLQSEDIALMAGDQIVVPSTGRYDEGLVRISAITPPGIRLFLSNLTVPATDNSKSQNSSVDSSVPYGTRFLTGLITANCVGGTGATNSARYGVLVTRNMISGETEVIERPIEEMMREPQEEQLNPYLMPNDGIACYDSGVTNLRDVAKTIADIISPFK